MIVPRFTVALLRVRRADSVPLGHGEGIQGCAYKRALMVIPTVWCSPQDRFVPKLVESLTSGVITYIVTRGNLL